MLSFDLDMLSFSYTSTQGFSVFLSTVTLVRLRVRPMGRTFHLNLPCVYTSGKVPPRSMVRSKQRPVCKNCVS